jgi:hypothetical protein
MTKFRSTDQKQGLSPWAAAYRYIDKWFDAGANNRALWIFIGLFVVLWTAFQIISYQSIDLRDDLTEIFAWSRHPSAGYYKHPPLAALMAAIWFAVFPVADWSFHLLAMLNAALGLFFVDLIARRYLDGDKRLLVLLLLLLTPFYQFHGQRFNPNQTLLSAWPIATYCFLRAFETRGWIWSIAAGVAVALAMLGKYYSIYLVAGIAAAALSHPARSAYLRSPSPYISALVGFACLTPNLMWLLNNGSQTYGYVLQTHSESSSAMLLWKAVLYALGGLAYVALAVAVYFVAAHPNLRKIKSIVWPGNPDRRMIIILLAVPLVLPMLTAPFFGLVITPLWTMSAWFLLPIVLLMPDDIEVTRKAAVRIAAGVLAISVLMVAAAPAVALARFVEEEEKNSGRAFYRDASVELTNVWLRTMQRPLTIVAGYIDTSLAVTFYSSSHPDSIPGFVRHAAPWVTDLRLKREGWAAICLSKDNVCILRAERLAEQTSDVVRVTYMAKKSWLGVEATVHMTFLLVPPRP